MLEYHVETRRLGGWATITEAYLAHDQAIGVGKYVVRTAVEDGHYPGVFEVRVVRSNPDTGDRTIVWSEPIPDTADSGGTD